MVFVFVNLIFFFALPRAGSLADTVVGESSFVKGEGQDGNRFSVSESLIERDAPEPKAGEGRLVVDRGFGWGRVILSVLFGLGLAAVGFGGYLFLDWYRGPTGSTPVVECTPPASPESGGSGFLNLLWEIICG